MRTAVVDRPAARCCATKEFVPTGAKKAALFADTKENIARREVGVGRVRLESNTKTGRDAKKIRRLDLRK